MDVVEKPDKKNIRDILALTPLQEGMLFHYLKEPMSYHYVEQLVLTISGQIDLEHFKKAWIHVVQDNEMLRTFFRWEKLEKPVQVVLKQHKPDLGFFDLSPIKDSNEKQNLLDKIKREDREKKFDLRVVPFRVILCKVTDRNYHIIISNHHILYDGWSTGIILKEFFQAYAVLEKGAANLATGVKSGYKEFIDWIQAQVQEKHEQFWREYLDGFDTPTVLPIKTRKDSTNRVESVSLILGDDIKEKLDTFINTGRVTLATVLYTAWGILLQKYCSSEDVIFGTTVAGRSARIKGIEDMVGLFINTIPLRVRAYPNEKISALLFRIHRIIKEREEFDNTPLVDIKNYSMAEGSESIFDNIVTIENYPLDNRLVPGSSLLSVNLYSMAEMTHYDLTLGILLFNEIKVKFTYNRGVIDKQTVSNLAQHFKKVVQTVLENPEEEVYQLEIISKQEKNRILYDFNSTEAEFPGDKTIPLLFEEQVKRTPDHIAMVGPSISKRALYKSLLYRLSVQITYKELNEKSNQLALLLGQKGVAPDVIVGIMVERSLELNIGILGILKAGGAYLPLDPDYPANRIRYILADSKVNILVKNGDSIGDLESKQELFVLNFEHLDFEFVSNSQYLVSNLNSSNLAYVIYTSGSTGHPKGVMVQHQNVINVVWWFGNKYNLGPGVHVLQMSDYTFDPSVNQVFGTLHRGAMLCLISQDILTNMELLRQHIEKHHIQVVNFVPIVLTELLSSGPRLESIRVVLSGGEKLGNPAKDAILAKGYRLYNQYGPTETTIDALVEKCSTKKVTLGKPIANVKCYILDKFNNLAPIGIPGELYVAGAGVARGYLNKPELTTQKFLELASMVKVNKKEPGKSISMSDLPHWSHIYRTGDLARWLPEGNIEFLGRLDQQVKIRGFRVELGEIENQLLKYPGIKEVVVLCGGNENGDRYLCAYIVSTHDITVSGLKEYLSRYLPDYAIPSYFMFLDMIPLTPNGKIDRKALMALEIKKGESYVPPRNLIEKKLVKIWSEVLGIDSSKTLPPGIDDNFFQLGGHSLKATTLVYRVYKEFEVKIEINDVFSHPTIREMAQWVRGLEGLKYFETQPVEEKEYYQLSYAQRRLWVLCQFEEDSTAYNMPTAVVLSGVFQPRAFARAAQTLANRHESLRTIFVSINGEPRQKIIHDFTFKLELVDLRHTEEKKREEKTRQHYLKIANRAFDLEKGPLFRLTIIRVDDEKYVLVYNMHHIINDGWSQGIIYNELITLYNTSCQGKGNPFPPLELRYKDYTRWHNRLIQDGQFAKSGKYWLDKFKDKPNGIELPRDHPRKPVQTFNGGRVDFIIDNKRTVHLQHLSLDEDTTFFMSLLTLLNIFLYKYTGQEDIIIGAPIANRKRPELLHLVGFLVNTLVYRCKVDPALSFRQFLATVKKEALTCYRYQDFPFDLLMEQLELERDLSQSPIFNVMIAHNNTETIKRSLAMEGLKMSDYPYSSDFNLSKFDLIFFMDEVEHGVQVRLEYNSDLFDRSTIERMTSNFLVLVENVIENSETPVSALNILSRREYETVTCHFNRTRYDFPRLTLQQLFENQVEKLEDKIAVIYHEDRITYGELNKKANRIAHYLRGKYGVKPNDVIGISMDRSIDMIAVILGVIKSGAAYLAVDPTYPRDRVLFVLSDSQSKLLIIDEMRPQLFGDYTGEILDICSQWDAVEIESHNNPPGVNQPANILYVNYTSGSTGTPNGAMLSHDCLTNLIRWQNEKTSIDCSLGCLQFTSINFCVSFQEIMGTLTSGGELYLIGDIERQDIDYLREFLTDHQVEVLFLPFSYLNFLFNEPWHRDLNFKHNLKHIITAGEQLKITTGLKQLLNLNPHLQLHNHYGSTEMHVVTSYTLDASTAKQTSVPPVGKPISNIEIFILDEFFNPVPVGVYGELCVAGSTEILGYIKNKELTEKKLVKCPGLSGIKLYRSGDIGRWHADGNIELRGRKDFLVKIRGFRVEPGEIESKILSIEKVRECVVVVQEDQSQQKYLAAYVSVDGIDAGEIKRIIGNKLPQYMVPQIIILDNLPLMPNGKVDREKLPDPQWIGKGEREIVKPSNDVEQALVRIWSHLLGIQKEQIGVDVNFFALGGHSLKATTMMSKIHKELDVKVKLVDIFRRPSIREIARYIYKSGKDVFQALEPIEKREYHALASAQKRLYILQQMEKENIIYNMPGIFLLIGEIDRHQLGNIFQQLVDRHESFRTSFGVIEGKPVQRISQDVEFEIEYYESAGAQQLPCNENVDHLSIRYIKEFVRAFNLSKAPLFRVGLVKLEEEKHLLMVDVHHIISDGISIEIIKKELSMLYKGMILPELRLQYKDYSQWQNHQTETDQVKSQETYWMKQFEGEIPVLNLDTDFPRDRLHRFDGDTISFEIDNHLAGKLKEKIFRTGSTLYIVLLAVLNVLLFKYTEQEDIVVGIPIMGRPHDDLHNIIGMFVNMLPVRNQPRANKTFSEFLLETKASAEDAYENQDYPFEELVEKLDLEREPGRHPLVDVVIVLQNFKVSSYEFPGFEILPYELRYKKAKFDLNFQVVEDENSGKINIVLEFSTSLFKRSTAEKITQHYVKVLVQVARDMDIKLQDIALTHDFLIADSKILANQDIEYGF